MIIRELIKKAGHAGDKIYLKKHENWFKGQYITSRLSDTVLLKLINLEFIQMKCTILDDNINDHWKEILDFIDRQHIDEDDNRKNNLSRTILINNKYNTIWSYTNSNQL